MFCVECGTPHTDDARFCESCGASSNVTVKDATLTDAGRKALNYRRGFNRVGIVAWSVWTIAMLILPLGAERYNRNQAWAFNESMFKLCLSIANSSPEPAAKCQTEYAESMDRDTEANRLGTVYGKMGLWLLWGGAIAIFGVPLVAYGLLRSVVMLIRWLVRGFRPVVQRGTATARRGA